MDLIYINSRGESFRLTGEDNVNVTDGNLHTFTWNIEQDDNSSVISSIRKNPNEYDIKITCRGPLKERKALLNRLRDITEYDIYTEQPGRLCFGDYYIECFAKSSDTHVNDNIPNRSDNVIKFYCPYPMWIKEEKKAFYQTTEQMDDGTNYPHNFPFDFSTSKVTQFLRNDTVRECDFIMDIYGPAENPSITIANHEYKVNCVVGEGEILTINSREKTIQLQDRNNGIENRFSDRNRESYIFQMIPTDFLQVMWTGSYGFDITLLLERSEPEWI